MLKKAFFCFFIFLVALISPFLLPAYSATKIIPAENFTDSLQKRDPIPFKPLDMVEPGTKNKISPETVINMPEINKTVTKTLKKKNVNIRIRKPANKPKAKDYYGILNTYEKYYNSYGYSLRNTRHLGTTQRYNANYEKLTKDKQEIIWNNQEMTQRYGAYNADIINNRIRLYHSVPNIQNRRERFENYLKNLKEKYLIVPMENANPPTVDQIPLLVNVMKRTKLKHFEVGDQDKVQVWYRNTVETEHSFEGNVWMSGESKIGTTLWGWELNLIELSMDSKLVTTNNVETASSYVVFNTIGNKVNYRRAYSVKEGRSNGTEVLYNSRLWQGTFRFMAGPIPCYVELGLDARLNIEWSFKLNKNSSCENVKPSVGLNLVALGAVGVDGIASVGVYCDLTLLRFNYNIYAECTVDEIPDAEKNNTNQPYWFTLNAKYQIGGDYDILAGSVFLFYELLWWDGDVELFSFDGYHSDRVWLMNESESDYGLIYDPDLAMQDAGFFKESKFAIKVQKWGAQLPNNVTLKFESRSPKPESRGPHNVFFLYKLNGAEILKNNDPIGQQNFLYIFDGSENETLITNHLPDLYSIKDIEVSLHDCPINCDLDNTLTLNDGDIKNNNIQKSFVREADIGLGQLLITKTDRGDQYILDIPIDNFNPSYNIHKFELDRIGCQVKIYAPQEWKKIDVPQEIVLSTRLLKDEQWYLELQKALPIIEKPEHVQDSPYNLEIVQQLTTLPDSGLWPYLLQTPQPHVFYQKNTQGDGARFNVRVNLSELDLPEPYRSNPFVVLTVSLVKKLGNVDDTQSDHIKYIPIKDYCVENNNRRILWSK